MQNDFELLYMIRQKDDDALSYIIYKFNRLLWKRTIDYFSKQKPQGISQMDLIQEGYVGLYESLFGYKEALEVGFAYYINICVESHIKTALRKCRGMSYKLLDTGYSLDMQVADDKTLCLHEVVEDQTFMNNPSVWAINEEVNTEIDNVLNKLKPIERKVYHLKQNGYSYREISNMTQYTTKEIDNLLQKIKRLIRNRLC